MTRRSLPSDIEAEQGALGAMLMSSTAIDDVTALIGPADYYRPGHAVIHEAILSLRAAGQPVDAITVKDELSRRGELSRIQGAPYLHTLMESVPVAASAAYYARVVRDRSERRDWLIYASRITQAAEGDNSDLETVRRLAADQPAASMPAANSWRPIDLTAAVTGEHIDAEPELLMREDGRNLLYAGKIHTISGESESLKTWLVLLACAADITSERHVVFIDYEDCADGITGRMLALGCPGKLILDYFHYVQPAEPYTASGQAAIAAAVPGRPALVVIDGVTEAMAAHGLDPLSNADVAVFNARLPRPYAATGATVVMIDHVTKSRENRGRYAIGAQHKLAAVDGAAYTVELIKPFGHGLNGLAKLFVAKDRPGYIRAHSPNGCAGLLQLHSELDGSVTASIEAFAPEAAANAANAFMRPTILMERVSKVIENTPGLSARAVLAAAKGKREWLVLALELLITEGFVTVEKSGSSHRHKSARPYREADDDSSGEASDE